MQINPLIPDSLEIYVATVVFSKLRIELGVDGEFRLVPFSTYKFIRCINNQMLSYAVRKQKYNCPGPACNKKGALTAPL